MKLAPRHEVGALKKTRLKSVVLFQFFRRRSSADQAPLRLPGDGHVVRLRLRLAVRHPRVLVARSVAALLLQQKDSNALGHVRTLSDINKNNKYAENAIF
jgi:hypothetical protein